MLSWYPTLIQPPGHPPDWLFGPVWILLYIMMGVSLWLVIERGAPKELVSLFGLLLFFTLLWSFFFFAMQSPLLALIDIFLIDLTLLATIGACWKCSRLAALLLMPLLGWMLYATYLNFGIC